jgi:hypothetical protein
MRNKAAIAAIIQVLGISALAHELGHKHASTVSSWKIRGVIPVSYWPRVVAFAEKQGVAGITITAITEAHVGALRDSRLEAVEEEAPPTPPDLSARGQRVSMVGATQPSRVVKDREREDA